MNVNLRAHPMKNPVILALDVDSRDQALQIADEVGEIVGGIKLGPRLCLRYGADFVREIAERAPVFIDNKHFDIPSTMEAAIRASFEAGATLATVHALSGLEALTRGEGLRHGAEGPWRSIGSLRRRIAVVANRVLPGRHADPVGQLNDLT